MYLEVVYKKLAGDAGSEGLQSGSNYIGKDIPHKWECINTT